MASMIWAQDLHGAIGNNNELLWHIAEDLQYFKDTTLGHPVIMGSKTWESLPFKPLPKRVNAIVSRTLNYVDNTENIKTYTTPEQALIELPSAFIIGGSAIYDYYLDPSKTVFELIESLHVTVVHDVVENADAYAPSQDIIDKHFEISSKVTRELLDRKTDRMLTVDFMKYHNKSR